MIQKLLVGLLLAATPQRPGIAPEYVPPNAFTCVSGEYSDMFRGALATYLSAAQEPPLNSLSGSAYRLIVRSAVVGKGLVIRLRIDSNGKATVVTKSTIGGLHAFIDTSDVRTLATFNEDEFSAALLQSHFWRLPPCERMTKTEN